VESSQFYVTRMAVEKSPLLENFQVLLTAKQLNL